MPHFYHDKNQVAVRIDELVSAWWNNIETLYKNIQRYKDKDYGIKRLQRGCRNREMLIDFDSLDKEIRLALGDPRKIDNILDNYYCRDVEAVAYYNQYERPVFGMLDDEEKERYIINASILEAVIKLEEKRKTARKTVRMRIEGDENYVSVSESLWRDATSFNEVLKTKYTTEHTLPKSKPRFSQKLREYKDQGYYALIVDPTGARIANSRVVCERTVRLLNSIFSGQSHKPYINEVHAQYDQFLKGIKEVYDLDTGEIYDPKNFKPLSQATIYNYLTKWSSRLATHHKRANNRQRIMGKYKPYHQMHSVQYAGSLLSIDDRQPPFLYDGNKRVWFYMAIDVGSEFFTSWVHGESKEGIIMDFYKQLVRDYAHHEVAIPDTLECESSLNSSFVNTFLKPGEMFQHVRIEANNARGKFIENVFGRLRYGVERKKEGFRGRPFAKSETHQGDDNKKIQLSYKHIVAMVEEGILEWNNAPHPRVPGKTRREVFETMQHPKLKPTNYKSIIKHIGNTTKTSVNNGHLKFRHDNYVLGKNGSIALGSDLVSIMDVLDEKSVEVKWLEDNEGQTLKAHIYHKDRYICDALPPPRYSRVALEKTDQCDANRQLYSAYVASIEGYKKTQLGNLSKIEITDKEKTDKIIEKVSSTPAKVMENHPEETYTYTPKTHKPKSLKELYNH